jgi:hypothetical protein
MEENDLFKGLESFLTSADAIDEGLIATTQTPVENTDPVVTTNEDEPEFKGLSLDELSEVENEEVETDEPEVPVIDEPEEVVADTDNVEIYKSLSDFLKNEGIVEDEFDSPDAMRETFKKVIDSNIDDWKSSLPEEIHRLIENYQAGVPFNKLLDIASKEIELANIDEDTLVEDLDTVFRNPATPVGSSEDANIDFLKDAVLLVLAYSVPFILPSLYSFSRCTLVDAIILSNTPVPASSPVVTLSKSNAILHLHTIY